MKIEFTKAEIRQLADVLVRMYKLRDSVEDVVEIIDLAIELAGVFGEPMSITIMYGYLYTMTIDEKQGKEESRIGVLSIKGDSYVYEFK